jgi:hypothetical protein
VFIEQQRNGMVTLVRMDTGQYRIKVGRTDIAAGKLGGLFP